MNIGLYKRPKVATLLTTAYFTGILISACVLYVLQGDLSKEAALLCCRIVGVTLFIGIIALYYTARSRDERVVYLDRKAEVTDEKTSKDNSQSQLNDAALRNIINSGSNVPQSFLNEVCNSIGAGQGAIYAESNGSFELKHGYAIANENTSVAFKIGEGLVGRVAAESKSLYLDELPQGYITVFSGLGNASPTVLALVPVRSGRDVKGVIEIATFSPLNESTLRHLEELGAAIATTIK